MKPWLSDRIDDLMLLAMTLIEIVYIRLTGRQLFPRETLEIVDGQWQLID
jgi:hypothetical protein